MLETEVYIEHDATRRLQELGLTNSILQEVVGKVYSKHLVYVTKNEPPISYGMTLYLKITGALRDKLLPLGWKRDDYNNHSKTISPNGQVCIVVASGDNNTGQADSCSLSTKSPKGKITKQIINRNHRNQLALDFGGIPGLDFIQTPDLWFLLVYVDDKAKVINVELSQPKNVNNAGFVTDWAERVIIPSIPDTFEPNIMTETTDEINIDIHSLVGIADGK